YALAYAGLAECHLLLRRGGWVSEAAGRPAAERAPARAMALDPMLPEVQLHRVGSSSSWSCVGSGRTVFSRSARGETRWSVAHGFYGVFLAFAYRHDEAVAHVNAALDLDPLSPVVHGVCAMAMDLCREHLKAEHLIRRTLGLQADYIVGLWGLAIHLTATGLAAEAIPVAERLVSLSRAPIFVGTLGMAYGRAGRTDDLVRLELGERRSRGEYIAPASKVQFAIGRGDGALIRRA